MYDYFLTLSDEAQYIWSRTGKPAGKALFLAIRYATLGKVVLAVARLWKVSLTVRIGPVHSV